MGFSSSGGSVQVDNDTIKLNGYGQIYVNYAPTDDALYEMELEIIELQANAAVTPLDHDNLVSETFSDTDGYNDLVNTGNTDATHMGDRYGNSNAVALAHGVTYDTGGSVTNYRGARVTPNVPLAIKSVTKHSTSAATSCIIYDSSDNNIGSASFSGDVATFAAAVVLEKGSSYRIVVYAGGAGYTERYKTGGVPVSGTYLDWDGGTHGAAGSWNDDNFMRCVLSVTCEDQSGGTVIEIDLPTISGEVTDTELVVNDDDTRETGDSITYDIEDTDTTADTAQALNTKNQLTNPDGTKITGGKIKINLTPAGSPSHPTAPAVKTFCLKLWKA